jgi:hypothetical protein
MIYPGSIIEQDSKHHVRVYVRLRSPERGLVIGTARGGDFITLTFDEARELASMLTTVQAEGQRQEAVGLNPKSHIYCAFEGCFEPATLSGRCEAHTGSMPV